MERMLSKEHEDRLLRELRELDNQSFELDGKSVRPSQCYRWEANPLHLLFNTNCPSDLKTRIESILSRYASDEEYRKS